jgi:hypothetical protein
MLSSPSLAAELNHAIVTTMEECEKNAQMQENQESNQKPSKGGFFYVFLINRLTITSVPRRI